MQHINVEIKARCENQDHIRNLLKLNRADFRGTDRQVDTYFRVPNGKLKLREGMIENSLIFYQRERQAEPKVSRVILFENRPGSSLKEILLNCLTVLTVVDKKREIYFIGNVKFHLDSVKDLGTFVEIEAIDKDGTLGRSALQQQCEHYMNLFGITSKDLLSGSYCDLLAIN